MRIGVFAYDFPHEKTQTGLLRLYLEGIRIEAVFAAPWQDLKVPRSHRRIGPKGLVYQDPSKVATALGIPYIVTPHAEALPWLLEYNLDLGVILGARILPQSVINCFRIGILNMHPGMLPENRGLDNIKWAIWKDLSMGVTAHLIDRHVDRGSMIERKTIPIYKDDELLDLYIRIMHLEYDMMIDAIHFLEKDTGPLWTIPRGTRFSTLPPPLDDELPDRFRLYKARHGIC